jgi:hypothetical protein
MATPPDFVSGQILTAAQMNAVGMWLTNTTTIGTGVTSVPVTACFTSDFDNYRIVVDCKSSNAASSYILQLTGISSSTYFTNAILMSWNSATVTGYGPATRTDWVVSSNDVASTSTRIVMDISNPNNAERKYATATSQSGNGNFQGNFQCTSTSTATGITLSKQGDTMTGGTIKVYGYRK